MFFALHFFIRKLNQTLFVLLPISPLGRRTRRCWANTIKKRLLYGHFDASIPSKLAISSFYLHTQVFSRTIERRSGARKRRVRCVRLLLPSLYVVCTSTFITTQGNPRGEPVRFLPEFIHTQTQSMSDSKTLGRAAKTQNKEAINPFLESRCLYMSTVAKSSRRSKRETKCCNLLPFFLGHDYKKVRKKDLTFWA